MNKRNWFSAVGFVARLLLFIFGAFGVAFLLSLTLPPIAKPNLGATLPATIEVEGHKFIWYNGYDHDDLRCTHEMHEEKK